MDSRDDNGAGPPGTRDDTRIDDAAFGEAVASFDDPELCRKFEALELIGTGGMGAVYKVRHRHLDHVRAVKVLNRGARPDRVERLRREAAIGTELAHPNIATVYDLEELSNGDLAIVMEYLQGRDLRRRVEEDGALDAEEIPRLFAGVADALDRMHAAGVIHRDIKPANLFECLDGSVRILDFGVSRQLEVDSQLTRTGGYVGTPAFMAPEQFAGEPAGPATDIYSLGATIYYCLTAQLPFRATTEAELIAGILYGERPRASVIRPDLPRHVSVALSRAMDPEPGRRFHTAAGLLDALAREIPIGEEEPGPTVTAEPVLFQPPSAPEPRVEPQAPASTRRSRIAAAAFVVVALTVGLAAVWLAPRDPGPPTGDAGPGDASAATVVRRGGTLRIGTTTKVLSLDPLGTVIDEFAGIFPLIYDTLVEVDWTGAVQPALAERWESHDGHRRYVFHLRPGVALHSPDPQAAAAPELTAEDVRRSLERVFLWIAADENNPWRLVPPVEGTDAVLAGESGELAGVRALDEHTLEVRFTRPAPSFCHALAWPEWSILAAAALEPPVDGEPAFQPLGSGPYRVEQQSRSAVALVRHPGTWHRDAEGRVLPHPERVEIQAFRDPYMARTALVEGRIDLIVQLPQNVIDDVFTFRDRQVVMVDGWEQYQVGGYLDDSVREVFMLLVDRHSAHPLSTDARIRRAMDRCIRRADLTGRSTVPASGLLVEGMLGYQPADRPDGEEIARVLLAEAGYPDGEGLPPVSICGVEGQESELATLASHLHGVGFQTEIRVVSYETWMHHLLEGGCDLLDAHYSAMVIDDDPTDALLGVIATVGLEERSPEIASQVEELRNSADREHRAALLGELSAAVADDSMVLFLTHRRPSWPHFGYLAGPRVGGLVDPATGTMNPVRQRMRELWVR